MKRFTRISFILFLLPFILLFQNCDNNADLSSSEASQIAVQKRSIESMGVLQLKLPVVVNGQDLPEQETLIDIYKSTISDPQGHKYCPGYDFFYSLQNILNEAQLCVDEIPDAESVCTLEYHAPDAILLTYDNQEIYLGSEVNPCQKQHLCSPHKENFQLLISTFLNIKDTLKCPE